MAEGLMLKYPNPQTFNTSPSCQCQAHLVKSSGVRKARMQQTATTPAVATSAVSTACGTSSYRQYL